MTTTPPTAAPVPAPFTYGQLMKPTGFSAGPYHIVAPNETALCGLVLDGGEWWTVAPEENTIPPWAVCSTCVVTVARRAKGQAR